MHNKFERTFQINYTTHTALVPAESQYNSCLEKEYRKKIESG